MSDDCDSFPYQWGNVIACRDATASNEKMPTLTAKEVDCVSDREGLKSGFIYAEIQI